jgi:hypothetical protein
MQIDCHRLNRPVCRPFGFGVFQFHFETVKWSDFAVAGRNTIRRALRTQKLVSRNFGADIKVPDVYIE